MQNIIILLVLLQSTILKPLTIKVLFVIRRKIKMGEGRLCVFLRLRNGTLDHANRYIEWTLTMLLYKNTCQMSLEEQANI